MNGAHKVRPNPLVSVALSLRPLFIVETVKMVRCSLLYSVAEIFVVSENRKWATRRARAASVHCLPKTKPHCPLQNIEEQSSFTVPAEFAGGTFIEFVEQ